MSARSLAWRVLSVWLFCALVAPPCAALIIASGDGSGNTAAPEDDFGFWNVGDATQSAVYIGNGWVISANHVPEGAVRFRGVRYAAEPDSKVRLRNEGPGTSPDLALFRLEKPWPDLPSLRIRTRSPLPGDDVVLAGNGFDRGEPVDFEQKSGWRWAGTTSLRWGTNRVAGIHPQLRVSPGDRTDAFSMEFNAQAATQHEAQVAIGDSGGGVFIKNDGAWELAGVLIAANTYKGQPRETAVFGNLSLAADLSTYRDQILKLSRDERAADSCSAICGEGFALSLLAPLGLAIRARRQA
jgi:hypothetical protein